MYPAQRRLGAPGRRCGGPLDQWPVTQL